jgi:heme A synthase
METDRGFARLSTTTLLFNLGVIVWGAYVRASGSGAGCGDHWPRCNGQIIPHAPSVKTLIELTHRLTSGVALVLVVAMVVLARRRFSPGHPARLGAHLAGALIVLESLLGAGLVLLRLVAGNTSTSRGWYLAAHLTNTFALVAALTLTVWWARGGAPVRRPRGAAEGALLLGVALTILLAVSGGIAALGDTLCRAETLAQGIAMDFSPTAHAFLRLRIWHPVLAVSVGAYLVVVAWVVRHVRPTAHNGLIAGALTALYVTQLGLGVANLLLLAPVWLQLVHLLMADLVWIALVLLVASTLSGPVKAR